MSTGNIITEGATGSKSKEGVIQWVIPYYVPNIDQVLTVGKTDYEGCEEVSRTWSCNNDGTNPSYIVTVVYEGGSAESDQNTYGDEDSTVWSLDFEIAEEPIESHWNFEEIKKQYGGKWGDPENEEDWVFPKELPAGSSSGSGLGGKGKVGGGAKNPMKGVKTYLVMNCTASVSYTKKTLPKEVISKIGGLEPRIPDAPPQFNSLDVGPRNWLKMPPQISKRGNVWQINESWRLSEYVAWPKEVYPGGKPR
ncbi:MAG: hypothetical protein KGQ87_03750 [Verrucomicrobia bacterium]|nr:hypothetical protein [Verrucomicrobiota bacterium]